MLMFYGLLRRLLPLSGSKPLMGFAALVLGIICIIRAFK